MSSNFERLLFDLYDRDGIKLSQLMNEFQSGAVKLEDPVIARAKSLFSVVHGRMNIREIFRNE